MYTKANLASLRVKKDIAEVSKFIGVALIVKSDKYSLFFERVQPHLDFCIVFL